jgi:hypothetical protein
MHRLVGVEMDASAYIGRVGGLAVALGVGAAVATGHGVAWASPTESSSSTSESESSTSDDAKTGPDLSTINSSASKPPATKSTTTSTVNTATPSSPAASAADPGEDASLDLDEAETAVDADDEVAAEEEADADLPATRNSTKPKTDDPIRDVKKSSDGLAKKSAESSVSNLSAGSSTDDVETVKSGADEVATDQPAAALQRATIALTSTTLAAPSSVTTTQDVAPVMMASPQPTTARLTLPRLLTNLLSAFGLGAMASNLPGVPSWSPLGLALLALGARRETEQTFSTRTTTADAQVAALALTGAPTAAVPTEPGTTRTPVVISTNTHFIEFVTGAGNLNDTERRFGIGGTDLGIMWDNGIPDDPTTAVNEHEVLIAFGDTFRNSVPVRTGLWRMNTMFRSSDTTLSNGLYVPDGIQHDPGMYSGSPMSDPNFSREILGRARYAVGPEVAIIPTAAISVPGAGVNGATRQYMNFMSVRSWDTPGQWTTNYSGIAYSDDNGQNWRSELVPSSSIRTAAAGRSIVPYVSGNQNFQQGAFVKPPADSPEAAAGWVYSYGTPSGRGGTVYLSRVNQMQILDQTKYQYWDGSSWLTNKPSAAKPILPGTTTSFFGFFKTTTYPSVSEMSVQYNPYLKKYVMLYADRSNNVVMRTSATPQGTWSAPTTLVTSTKVPGLYAPMVHPWSGTTNLPAADGQYLYWNLSTWGDYQVRLMRTDLTKV